MKYLFRPISFAALLAGSLGVAASAQQVVVKTKSGSATFAGILTASDADTLTIKTSVGLMKMNRSSVTCEGAACPDLPQSNATVKVHGSDTVGSVLFPLIVKGFAQAQQADLSREMDLGEARTMFYLNEQAGAGDPFFNVEVQAAKSSTGFRSLLDETADIAMSSRPAKATEVEAFALQGRGDLLDVAQEYVVAVDSIVTVVSPGNPIENLTVDQMARIFSGRVRNWKEVGGIDMPVTVYTRQEESGTRGVFTDAILAPFGVEMSSSAVTVKGSKQMSQRVTADPGAIGYLGFASLGTAKSVDLIASCGIKMTPSAFSAKTEEYPLERRLRLFTDNRPLDPVAQELLDFAVSPKADALVQEAGFIDLGITLRQKGEGHVNINFQDYVDEPEALPYMTNLLTTLGTAQRLSATFRFESSSSRLDNKAQRDIARVIEFLNAPENKEREVIFAGYTDSEGGFAQNGSLSSNRAATVLSEVLNHPLAKGLDRSRFKTAGFSELAPVACNDSPEGQRRNRRVELWLN